MARPVNVYAPDELVVVVAAAAPLRVTVAPLPPLVGVIVPEMLKLAVAVEVKFAPVMLAVESVSASEVGLKVKPVWLGVTAYVPFASPLKVNAPDEFVVVVALAVPLRVNVVPEAPGPLTVPEMENVCGALAVAVKFALVMLAVVMVSAREVGPKVKPVWLGVMV